jgi:hypothetical protein
MNNIKTVQHTSYQAIRLIHEMKAIMQKHSH